MQEERNEGKSYGQENGEFAARQDGETGFVMQPGAGPQNGQPSFQGSAPMYGEGQGQQAAGTERVSQSGQPMPNYGSFQDQAAGEQGQSGTAGQTQSFDSEKAAGSGSVSFEPGAQMSGMSGSIGTGSVGGMGTGASSGTGMGTAYGSGSQMPGAGYAQAAFEGHSSSASQQKPSPKRHAAARKVLAGALALILAAGCGFGGAMAALYYAPGLIPTATTNVTIKPNDSLSTGEAIAKKVIPSVVGISTTGKQNVQTFFGPVTQQVQGVGTGIIVDEKGYILTNSHVVNDGQTENITVQLADGREVDGRVLWNDSGIDLAIVKIEATNLTAAELGDSEDIQIGSYAAAIGNPMGLDYARSMSQGIISGLNRSITVQGSNGSGTTMDGLIQTDASINHGNSGGPLLNSQGQVIGINTAKADSGEGMGFAIPINTAKPIVDQIKEKGEFQRSYIGIAGWSVDKLLEQYPDAKLGSETGVYIQQIYTESPAAQAGLREGDIIAGLNGEKIETMQQLTSKLFQYRPGDSVTLEIVRDNSTQKVNVTLTASVDQRKSILP